MGRPSLGEAARDVILKTKGTQREADLLAEKYGSVYRGVREGIRLALSAGHRHRRGDVIGSKWEAGTEIRQFSCAVDGCGEVLS